MNSSSIDITLGRWVLIESFVKPGTILSLREGTPLTVEIRDLRSSSLILNPGQFILAQSAETFHLPLDISADYKLNSSMGRIALEHMNAGWCDAGWHDSVLTLELKNMTRHHCIELQEGDRIGQMVFFRHRAVPLERSYAVRGRYNGDDKVIGVKREGHGQNGRQ